MTGPAIGELRHRMTLQRPERVAEEGGAVTVTWATLTELWASLTASSGGEGAAHDTLSGAVFYEVWMRHRSGVAPDMRLLLGSRIFDIRAAVDPDGRRRWLKCSVEEKRL